VIYFAAIASADRRGVRLSELAPDELERGYEWVRNHDWVDTPIRELFR
jgi:hypothetical protein